MVVTLDELKNYLRVDFAEDDALLTHLISSAERLCMDVIRTDDPARLAAAENAKAAYLYEHREDADHHALGLTLRSLLFGCREEGF